MEYVRTVKVPVYYLTTRRKRSYLERLTARLTHAVRAWSGIIEEHGLKSVTDCSPFEQVVKDETGLSAGFASKPAIRPYGRGNNTEELIKGGGG